MKKFTKKAIPITLAILMMIGVTMPAIATHHSFDDVGANQWYANAVQFVYENNIMSGIGNNQFDPQGNITRSAVTALLFRIHNGRTANEQDDRNNNFNDVENAWYAPYVTWAFNNNIVSGTSPTTFNPQGNITRQEFATMVYRYAMNMTDLQDGNVSSAQWSQFTDREQIATWAYSALRWMNFHGIVTGSTSTTISPTATVTRAEAAMIMMRFVRERERLSAPFVLTISVEETTLTYAELYYRHFGVYAELANQSGQDLEIIVDRLFFPRIPNWRSSEVMDPPIPETILFLQNGVIRREPVLSSGSFDEPRRFGVGASGFYGDQQEVVTTLPAGTHKLTFDAVFYILREHGKENQRIEVRSNTIVLTVLPSMQ